jgi:hypothetical protein
MASLFKHVELLHRVDSGISSAKTGRPVEFAVALGISERKLYDILDEMKSYGAPIVYSRISRTYSYGDDFDIESIFCKFK